MAGFKKVYIRVIKELSTKENRVLTGILTKSDFINVSTDPTNTSSVYIYLIK